MERDATGNSFLNTVATLDADAVFSVLAEASLVDFVPGRPLQRAGEPIEFCYFPTDGLLVMAWVIDEDTQVNTIGIGSDGAVHAALGTDLDEAPHHVLPCLPGKAWQVRALIWQNLLNENHRVRKLAACYADFLLARTQQALACHTRHDVESRFCRWLFELNRWQNGQPLAITHEGLSQLLGVRRTTITLLARSLQNAGIISYSRGRIEVTDPYALRQASCRCHELRHRWPRKWQPHRNGQTSLQAII